MKTTKLMGQRLTKLPSDLVAAYDWTDSAGELGMFRQAQGDVLESYIRDSVENCRSTGDGHVSADDLMRLHVWLGEATKLIHIYRLVPAGTKDVYAAGYDGNKFDSRAEAEEAIPGLRACFPEYDHDWDVIEDTE